MPSSHLILIVPFSSCPQSLSASGSFPMNQLFAWGSQSTGVSALASFLPKKSQGWSPSEWTGWISGNPYQVIISSWYWWTLNFSPSEWSMVLSLNYEFVLPWLLVKWTLFICSIFSFVKSVFKSLTHYSIKVFMFLIYLNKFFVYSWHESLLQLYVLQWWSSISYVYTSLHHQFTLAYKQDSCLIPYLFISYYWLTDLSIY